jgi:molecular chaperone GrpE (heat shock protein)
MQALAVVETDTALPDTVIEEIEGGYLYGEQVLKLARVTVAKERSEKGQ